MKKQKTKLIKARIINEDGDLAFDLIEVPAEDLRPEFDPKSMKLTDSKGVQLGKGPRD